jgi:hypothetical protein
MEEGIVCVYTVPAPATAIATGNVSSFYQLYKNQGLTSAVMAYIGDRWIMGRMVRKGVWLYFISLILWGWLVWFFAGKGSCHFIQLVYIL